MVMRTTLSKREFAQALGMKEGDLFVQKMFNIVDKDGDDRISFQVCVIFMIVLWEFGFEKVLLFFFILSSFANERRLKEYFKSFSKNKKGFYTFFISHMFFKKYI